MKTIQEFINKITEIGIDFNQALIGDRATGGFVRQFAEFEHGEEVKGWIALREMGTVCAWLNKATHQERYSKDVSTIIYGDYFFYNRISFIFQELNRITKGAFTFEVIDEFDPIFDANQNKNGQDFWDNSDRLKGAFAYNCKYILMGRTVELKYKFSHRDWTSLDAIFISQLLTEIHKELEALNVTYLDPVEFLTFIVADKEVKSRLKADLRVDF